MECDNIHPYHKSIPNLKKYKIHHILFKSENKSHKEYPFIHYYLISPDKKIWRMTVFTYHFSICYLGILKIRFSF